LTLHSECNGIPDVGTPIYPLIPEKSVDWARFVKEECLVAWPFVMSMWRSNIRNVVVGRGTERWFPLPGSVGRNSIFEADEYSQGLLESLYAVCGQRGAVVPPVSQVLVDEQSIDRCVASILKASNGGLYRAMLTHYQSIIGENVKLSELSVSIQSSYGDIVAVEYNEQVSSSSLSFRYSYKFYANPKTDDFLGSIKSLAYEFWYTLKDDVEGKEAYSIKRLLASLQATCRTTVIPQEPIAGSELNPGHDDKHYHSICEPIVTGETKSLDEEMTLEMFGQ